jgi:hypothetical protein
MKTAWKDMERDALEVLIQVVVFGILGAILAIFIVIGIASSH